MTQVIEPSIAFNIIGANTVVENAAQRILLVGQKLPAGSLPAGALAQNVALNQEDTLFGVGSMLAVMFKSIRAVNGVTPVDVIPLDDDGSAVDATSLLTIAGTFAGVGSVSLRVGNILFSYPVTTVDTPTTVATALTDLITANTQCLASAANVAGALTLTAKNGGTLGNFISIDSDMGGTGFTIAFTNAFINGAADPDVSTILDLVGNTRYQTIIWPYGAEASLAPLETFLDDRFDADNLVLDGIGLTGLISTAANAITVAGARNNKNIVMILDKQEVGASFVGPASTVYMPIVLSTISGIRALRLTPDASISQFSISTFGPRDAFGGPALGSKPYFNTPLPGLSIVGVGRGYTLTEIQLVNNSGGTVIGNNPSSTSIILGGAITTYLTDTAGNSDISFKFLNYVDTASGSREYFLNNLRARFAQSRLTTGDVVAGRDQANEGVIRAYVEKLYQDLSGPDFVLLETGNEAITFFKDNLTVVIDISQGLVTITMKVILVTQLREIIATVQISFGTNQ